MASTNVRIELPNGQQRDPSSKIGEHGVGGVGDEHHVELQTLGLMERRQREEAERQKLKMQHESQNALASDEELKELSADKPYVRDGKKVGRNDPCPCGSGKKYKACHGKLA